MQPRNYGMPQVENFFEHLEGMNQTCTVARLTQRGKRREVSSRITATPFVYAFVKGES